MQLGIGDSSLAAAEPALPARVQDEHDYVRRMALHALGRVASPHAEPLCGPAWASGREYQRIMALRALKAIQSPRLRHYVLAAKAEGRKFLAGNAIDLEQGTTGC